MKELKIGCSTVIVGCAHYTAEDYVKLLREYKEMGIQYIEYSHPQPMNAEECRIVRAEAEKLGMVNWSVHAVTWGAIGDFESTWTLFRHDTDMAKLLGCKIVVLHPGDMTVAHYREVGDVAAEKGLRVALETGCGVGYKELIALVDEINHPAIGINIDTGHSFIRDEKDVSIVVRAAGERLITMHMHDNFGTKDDHQAPGVGAIDWKPLIAALRDGPYQGPLMMELTDSASGRSKRDCPALAEMTLEHEATLGVALFKHLWSL